MARRKKPKVWYQSPKKIILRGKTVLSERTVGTKYVFGAAIHAPVLIAMADRVFPRLAYLTERISRFSKHKLLYFKVHVKTRGPVYGRDVDEASKTINEWFNSKVVLIADVPSALEKLAEVITKIQALTIGRHCELASIEVHTFTPVKQ